MSERLFDNPLPVIGVVHLPPLPGAPRSEGDFEAAYTLALDDARTYAEAQVDALLVENHGDAPFAKDGVEPHVAAFLAVAARAMRHDFGLPVGINCLRNDARSALGAAAVSGASFIRVNVLLGVTATDQGLVEGAAAELLRYRRRLESRVAIFADVDVKFGTPLYRPAIADFVPSLVDRGGADALIVTGTATGSPPDPEEISRVAEAAPQGVSVFAGSGVRLDNLPSIAARAGGFIVGSGFKRGGVASEVVDPERVRQFMEAVHRLRGHAG